MALTSIEESNALIKEYKSSQSSSPEPEGSSNDAHACSDVTSESGVHEERVVFAVDFDDDVTSGSNDVEALRHKLLEEDGHEVVVTSGDGDVSPIVVVSRDNSAAPSCERSRASSFSRKLSTATPKPDDVTSAPEVKTHDTTEQQVLINREDTDLTADMALIDDVTNQLESYLQIASDAQPVLSFSYPAEDGEDDDVSADDHERRMFVREIFAAPPMSATSRACRPKRRSLAMPPHWHEELASKLGEIRARSESF